MATDEQKAEWERQEEIDSAVARHIANRMASPCIPHYDHIRDARNMLRFLKEVAIVDAHVERLQRIGLLRVREIR